MKSPSQLTVVELKKALKGVPGTSALKRDQLVRKYRYHMSNKGSKSPKKRSKSSGRKPCKKSQYRSPKTHRCRSRKSSPKKKSPKRSAKKSPKRGPRPPCRSGKVRRTSRDRCTVPGTNAYKTVTELKEEAKDMGLKGLSGKTKTQIISMIKRQIRCPSPKVFDSMTGACRDRKKRVVRSPAQRKAAKSKSVDDARLAAAKAIRERADRRINEINNKAAFGELATGFNPRY
jgi:hypothetical protein